MNGEQLSFLEQLASRMRLGSGTPAKRLSPIEAESGRGVSFHRCSISHNNMQREGMRAVLGSDTTRPVEVAPLHDRVAVCCNNEQFLRYAQAISRQQRRLSRGRRRGMRKKLDFLQRIFGSGFCLTFLRVLFNLRCARKSRSSNNLFGKYRPIMLPILFRHKVSTY